MVSKLSNCDAWNYCGVCERNFVTCRFLVRHHSHVWEGWWQKVGLPTAQQRDWGNRDNFEKSVHSQSKNLSWNNKRWILAHQETTTAATAGHGIKVDPIIMATAEEPIVEADTATAATTSTRIASMADTTSSREATATPKIPTKTILILILLLQQGMIHHPIIIIIIVHNSTATREIVRENTNRHCQYQY